MERGEFEARLNSMNQQQREAVCAVEGAILLLAVPGSGKTTVLVARLGYMVCCCGVEPTRILAMTYTVAATKEMKARFGQLFGEHYANAMEFRTINGISSKIIAHYSRTRGRGQAFELMDNEGEISKIISGIYREVCGEFATPGVIRDVRTAITYVKNMMLTQEEISKLENGIGNFPAIYDRYCAELKNRRLMDYDDQMKYALNILKTYPEILEYFQNQYPYICVDESQDTSKIQHAIIRLLAQKHGNLFMVGDEDQSIYGFRAAYPDALMHFEKDYNNAKVLLMEQNYRSTPEILKVADAFIRATPNRHPKTIRAVRPTGAPVHVIYTTEQEMQYPYLLAVAQNCEKETAVLYRNNDSVLPLIDLLDRSGVPYNCRQLDDNFFSHRMITDMIDIIRFAEMPHSGELFLRIYYKFGAGISKKAAEYACEKSRASGKPILQELLWCPELPVYARDTVRELMDSLPFLLEDAAQTGVDRIWNAMGYGDYAKRHKLDINKLAVLRLLAKQEDSLAGLLRRMEQLRELIATHRNPGGNFRLSTIHSSKGLEYDTVYLLDVVDGVLPAVAAPNGEDEEALRQYYEERRLFYVAMTRAKNELYLFDCAGSQSSFVAEIVEAQGKEAVARDDVFASIRKNLCGKSYTHRKYGGGKIVAHCDEVCMIAYRDRMQWAGLEQMLREREIAFRKNEPRETGSKVAGEKTKRRKLTPEERKNCIREAVPGRELRHIRLGVGVITEYQAPYVKIKFPKEKEIKVFSLLDAVQNGFLIMEQLNTQK